MTLVIEKECLNRLRNGFVDGIIIAGTGRNGHLLRDIHAGGIAGDPDRPEAGRQHQQRHCRLRRLRLRHRQIDTSIPGCREIGLINGTIKPYALPGAL